MQEQSVCFATAKLFVQSLRTVTHITWSINSTWLTIVMNSFGDFYYLSELGFWVFFISSTTPKSGRQKEKREKKRDEFLGWRNNPWHLLIIYVCSLLRCPHERRTTNNKRQTKEKRLNNTLRNSQHLKISPQFSDTSDTVESIIIIHGH